MLREGILTLIGLSIVPVVVGSISHILVGYLGALGVLVTVCGGFIAGRLYERKYPT